MSNAGSLQCAILAVILAGRSVIAGPAEITRGWKSYSDTKAGISVAYPEAWKPLKNISGCLVAFASPREGAEDDFTESVNITEEDLSSEMPVATYKEAALAHLKGIQPNFILEEQGKDPESGAEWFIHSGGEGKDKHRFLSYCAVRGKKAYVITCTAKPHTFDQCRKIFETSVKSFRFLSD